MRFNPQNIGKYGNSEKKLKIPVWVEGTFDGHL